MNIKKSSYIERVYKAIDSMFNGVGDNTKIGTMFSIDRNPSGNFTRNDFINFLKSPFLVNYSGIYDGIFKSDGSKINLELFYKECANELLKYFESKNLTKDLTFFVAFPYQSITDPAYFKGIATIMVTVLEKYGKPPYFHKTQDKVLKYDWELEKLTIDEVFVKINKKLPELFEIIQDGEYQSISLKIKELKSKKIKLQDLEEPVKKIVRPLEGWHIYQPNSKTLMVINH